MFSEIVMVRMTPNERARLRRLAGILGVPDSTVLRRLLNTADAKPAVIEFVNDNTGAESAKMHAGVVSNTVEEAQPCN